MKNTSNPHQGLSEQLIQLLRNRASGWAAVEEQKAIASLGLTSLERVYLSFRLHRQLFAVPLRVVREVISLRQITPVPRSPHHLAGLVRLRGKVIALIDLKRFWVHDQLGQTDSDLAIVVETEGVEFGFVCSEINELLDLSPEDIQPLPGNLAPKTASCLSGMTRQEVLLISPPRLLSEDGFLIGALQKTE